MGGFIKMSNDVVGTIRRSNYLPEQLKTKAIGVFFTLAVLVDWHFNAAHVRNKKHLASVCGGNIGETELILGALEKLNLITWARSARCWILVMNPYAKCKNLGTEESKADLEAAVAVYKEAKLCGALSEYHYGMIERFIDDTSVASLKSNDFITPNFVLQTQREDEDDGFGGFST
jgi:hypothetical protein